MVTIIKTEFMKLKRYFIVWIGVSLMLLTVLLTLFTTMADDGMVWDYQFLFEQVVKHFVTMIFPMCITLISGYMISREYTDDTLKNIETLPISFRKLLAGKLIVSAILSLFLGIVCFVFTVIANFIMGYDGFALIPALTGLVQMALLGFFLYLTMLGVLAILAVCQQTGCCKREIAALKGIEQVGFPQLRSALFVQKLFSGERVVLVNEVRFDGGVIRVLRADMLERCHTVHPELSRR